MLIWAFSFGKILCMSKPPQFWTCGGFGLFRLCHQMCLAIMSWTIDFTTYIYNTLKMKQIPILKPKFATRLRQMQDLKIWNQIVWIEIYEGYGFTTSRGSTCVVPPVYLVDWNIASWNWNTKFFVPLTLFDSSCFKKKHEMMKIDVLLPYLFLKYVHGFFLFNGFRYLIRPRKRNQKMSKAMETRTWQIKG
jgi:hypothetical protein